MNRRPPKRFEVAVDVERVLGEASIAAFRAAFRDALCDALRAAFRAAIIDAFRDAFRLAFSAAFSEPSGGRSWADGRASSRRGRWRATCLGPIAIAGLALVASGCGGLPTTRADSVGAPDSGATGSLRVEVVAPAASGAIDRDATLRAALFADPRGWPSGAAARRVLAPFIDGRGMAVFDELPHGRYAVVAFVDLDGDGELDRGAFGLPLEPIAYGNDAKPRFGPPPFEACAVEVAGERLEVVMTLVVE